MFDQDKTMGDGIVEDRNHRGTHLVRRERGGDAKTRTELGHRSSEDNPAGTSSSTPSSSSEDGHDKLLGVDPDYCRRILVRGKDTEMPFHVITAPWHLRTTIVSLKLITSRAQYAFIYFLILQFNRAFGYFNKPPYLHILKATPRNIIQHQTFLLRLLTFVKTITVIKQYFSKNYFYFS